jgi:biotin carboxyl carrier protein
MRHEKTQKPDTRNLTPDTFRMPFARTSPDIAFSFAGQTYRFTPATDRPDNAPPRRRASGALIAPMVGLVADVMVQAGQAVEAYQPVVVVEAMKVMAALEAPFAGTVAKVYVEKGQQVPHGAPLVDIQPLSEE